VPSGTKRVRALENRPEPDGHRLKRTSLVCRGPVTLGPRRTPPARFPGGLLRSPAGEQRRQFAGARRPGSRRHIDVSGIQVPHAGGEVIEVAVGANAHPVRAPLGVDAEVIARARPMPSQGPTPATAHCERPHRDRCRPPRSPGPTAAKPLSRSPPSPSKLRAADGSASGGTSRPPPRHPSSSPIGHRFGGARWRARAQPGECG
jgi:hypothetical protein